MGIGEDSSNILRSLAEKKANRVTPPLEALRPKQEQPAETHEHPDTKGAGKTPLLERLLAEATAKAQDEAAIAQVRATIGEMKAADNKPKQNEQPRGLQKLLHTEGEHDDNEKIAPVVKAFQRGEVPGKILSK